MGVVVVGPDVVAQRVRLLELVDELTMSGAPQLGREAMTEVKKICKASAEHVDHAYHYLMSQLGRNCAEIRLSAVLVASELFSRSHRFRTLLLDDFEEFLALTMETDFGRPLPPPKEAAVRLKRLTTQAVRVWHATYGSAYKRLALGYDFLERVKKVDFSHNVEEEEEEVEDSRRKSMEKIYGEAVEKATKEMEEARQEIEETLREMDSCMKLLFSDGFGPPPGFWMTCDDLRLPDPIRRGSPNNAGVDREMEEKDRIDVGSLGEEEGEENRGKQSEAETGERKRKRSKEDGGGEDTDWEEDEKRKWNKEEEWKEVEKSSKKVADEAEAAFIRSFGLISHAYSLDIRLAPSIHVKETKENRVAISAATRLRRLIVDKHLPAAKRWVRLFAAAPCLDDNGQLSRRALELKTSLEAALEKHQELHIECKNGRRSEETKDSDDDDEFEDVPDQEGFEPHILLEHLLQEEEERAPDPPPCPSTTSSNMTAAEEVANLPEDFFAPITHHCHAPLANGKLCPRQDRFKCPFHGAIVPRDAWGRPTRQEDREREERRKQQHDWRDYKLMRAIEAATGEDLGSDLASGRRGGKERKKRHPFNLSKLKAHTASSRSRLERKVKSNLMRKVMDRVVARDVNILYNTPSGS